MPKKRISALLWRRVNRATADTLKGISRGQYDIRLTRIPGIAAFFRGLEHKEETALGGYTVEVPVEPYDGTSPIPSQILRIRNMGESSQRKDWYIRAQRPDTAYPIWREGRGLPTGFVPSPNTPHFILLIRDTEDKFHARWLSEVGFSQLSEEFREMLNNDEVGVHEVVIPDGDTDPAFEIHERLKQYFNILIYGPPGTGKTYIMQQVARYFSEDEHYVDTSNEATPIITRSSTRTKIGWVTFHQSYSYEEFVVGLRPDPASSQLLSLTPSPGLLLELAEFARRPGNSALLIIDEINRGNVSRIFGEFITLLEPDKRLRDDGAVTVNTVQIRLPYIKPGVTVEVDVGTETVQVPNPFTLPRRLYTLASMNSVDKSIAPLDSALRRRFHIVNLAPDIDEMSKQMGLGSKYSSDWLTLTDPLEDVSDVKKLSLSLLNALNRRISFYLGTEYSLGHWYLNALRGSFTSVEDAKSALINIWSFQLLPQLEELFHGRVEQLETVLRLNEFSDDSNTPVYLERPESAIVELGGVPYLKRREVSIDATIRFLRNVAGVRELVKPSEPVPDDDVSEQAVDTIDQNLGA